MASLQDSLRMKSSSVKAPSLSGPRPLIQPDVTAPEGQSGGIAASKAKKNAASTNTGKPTPSSDFLRSIGGSTSSDKTVGYF